MALDFNQIRELLLAIAETDIAEVTLKSADFELSVRKHAPLAPAIITSSAAIPVAPAPIPAISAPIPDLPAKETLAPTATPIDKKWVDITSPMVGTFYRAPAPDEAPFVEVGDRIRVGQTACIIEAMKLMNEIEAEVSGQVMEILVKNAEPVEYGQVLMRINPD